MDGDFKMESPSLVEYIVNLLPNIDVTELTPLTLLPDESRYKSIHTFLGTHFKLEQSKRHRVKSSDNTLFENEVLWISKLFPKLSRDYIQEQLDILVDVSNRAEILVRMLVHSQLFRETKQVNKRPANVESDYQSLNKIPKIEGSSQETTTSTDSQKTVIDEDYFNQIKDVPSTSKSPPSCFMEVSIKNRNYHVDLSSLSKGHKFITQTIDSDETITSPELVHVLSLGSTAANSSTDQNLSNSTGGVNEEKFLLPDASKIYDDSKPCDPADVCYLKEHDIPSTSALVDLTFPQTFPEMDSADVTESFNHPNETPEVSSLETVPRFDFDLRDSVISLSDLKKYRFPESSSSRSTVSRPSSTVSRLEPIASTSDHFSLVDNSRGSHYFNLIECLANMTGVEKHMVKHFCYRRKLCISQKPNSVMLRKMAEQILRTCTMKYQSSTFFGQEYSGWRANWQPLYNLDDVNNPRSLNRRNSSNEAKIDITDEVLVSTHSTLEDRQLRSQNGDCSESLITASVSRESQMSKKLKVQSQNLYYPIDHYEEPQTSTASATVTLQKEHSHPGRCNNHQPTTSGAVPKQKLPSIKIPIHVKEKGPSRSARIRQCTAPYREKNAQSQPLSESSNNNDEAVLLLQPADPDLVKALCQIFPDACPKYIKNLCTGKVNNAFVLDELLTVILGTENQYPKRPVPEPEVEICPEEQFAILKEVLPDADPDYLKMLCNQYEGKSEMLKCALNEAVESGKYPTMKDYQRRQQISAQQKQYTTEFNIESFVKTIPDPMAFFSDPARIVKLDHISTNYAMITLRNIYDRLPVRLIQSCFNKTGKFLTTALELENISDQNTLKSRRRQLPVPATIDNIPLLQEIAYFINKPAIEYYMKNQKKAEETEREEARKNGLLTTCGCCYDDDVLPKEMLTCNNGCVFCKNCIIRSTEVLFGEGKLEFPCLAMCSGEFSLQTLQVAVSPKLFSKLAQKKALAEVKAAGIDELEMCPFCDFATIPAEGDKIFSCLNPECMKQSCRACKEPSHIPLRCDEVEKDDEVKARVFIENKMTEALLRKCWKCGVKFFKEEGCNKMTCSCGAKMCYICNQPVTDYKHFNGQGGDRFDLCPLYSDNNKINKENVLRGAAEAKAEIGNKELKIDPAADINKHYKNKPSTSLNLDPFFMPMGGDINGIINRLIQPRGARPHVQPMRQRLNALRARYDQERLDLDMAMADINVEHLNDDAGMDQALAEVARDMQDMQAWYRRRR